MKGKIKLIRNLKYYFYRFGIHNILPEQKLLFLGHLSGVSRWISQQKNLSFPSSLSSTFDYKKRFELYDFVIQNEIKEEAVDYFEFGVSKGVSFRWWAEKIKHSDSKFYGFDTFTGLPEDWGDFKKGAMDNGNEPPEMDDARCSFYQGLFQQTLFPFLENYRKSPSDRKKIILMDADLYSSTLFVLTTLSPYIKKGDVIIFDEFNVPMHEYKAFQEWVASFYIKYTVLGHVNNFYCTAIRID